MTAQTINYDDPNAPWIPSFLYAEGPRTRPCGHHEGYHAHSGACRYQRQCGCTGLPPDCLTPIRHRGDMTPERSDTGTRPHLHRGELYRRARQVREIADIILDCTVDGRAANIPRAESLLAKIAAICGNGPED